MIGLNILSKTLDSYIIYFFKSGFFNATNEYIGTSVLIIVSLLLSVIYGGLIGAQREKNGHPAGFRTHILISLGSTLLMIISLYGADNMDQMRLAAAGVTGIGFLGAGSIIQNGFSIKGLTTAASVWVTMAIGMCCGTGYFLLATISVIFSILCLTVFQKVEFGKFGKNNFILIVTDLDKQPIQKILKICDEMNVEVLDVDTSLVKSNNKNYLRLTLKVKSSEKGYCFNLLNKINENLEPIESKILH